jgi:NADH-quinone oxidoreductase subunit M
VVLSACYLLWLYQRAFLGQAAEAVRTHVYDLRPREWAAIVPLLLLMVWMGTVTRTFLPPISASSARILEQTKVNAEFLVENPPARGVLTDAR